QHPPVTGLHPFSSGGVDRCAPPSPNRQAGRENGDPGRPIASGPSTGSGLWWTRPWSRGPTPVLTLTSWLFSKRATRSGSAPASGPLTRGGSTRVRFPLTDRSRSVVQDRRFLVLPVCSGLAVHNDPLLLRKTDAARLPGGV